MKKVILTTLLLCFALPGWSQENGWPAMPGFDEGEAVVYSQGSFLRVLGAAALSYGLAEFVGKDTNLHYYQVRGGFWGAQYSTSILMESFGVEKRVAPWFALNLELSTQQWFSQGDAGLGFSFIGYYRWHAFGKRKFSPFLEHGTGVHYGLQKFPSHGSKMTFHLTTALGVEYKLPSKNKVRLSYGHLHQSNNGLFPENPGIYGNGIQASYSWYWVPKSQKHKPGGGY